MHRRAHWRAKCAQRNVLGVWSAQDQPQPVHFTQQDPIGIAGGANVYGFASGDPVNFSDPFGLCVPWPACALVAGRAGAAAGTLVGAGVGALGGGIGAIPGAAAGNRIGWVIGAGIATAGAIALAAEASSDGAAEESPPTAGEIIADEKKGSINRVFPEQMRDLTFGEINKLAKAGNKIAQTARKLLTDKRFDK